MTLLRAKGLDGKNVAFERQEIVAIIEEENGTTIFLTAECIKMHLSEKFEDVMTTLEGLR